MSGMQHTTLSLYRVCFIIKDWLSTYLW